jgi:hypothetical protein
MVANGGSVEEMQMYKCQHSIFFCFYLLKNRESAKPVIFSEELSFHLYKKHNKSLIFSSRWQNSNYHYQPNCDLRALIKGIRKMFIVFDTEKNSESAKILILKEVTLVQMNL